MSNKANNHNSASVRVPGFRISLKAVIFFGAIITTALVASLTYFNWDAITDFVTEAIESVLMWTGLGIIIIGGWVILAAAFIKSSKFRGYSRTHYRILIGMFGVSVLVWGLLDWIILENGFPGWTRASMSTSLGGTFGDIITGNNKIQTSLILTTLGIISSIVFKPDLIHLSWRGMRICSIAIYLTMFTIIRSITRLYRNKSKNSPIIGQGHLKSVTIPPEALSPHIRESEVLGDISGMDVEVDVQSDDFTPQKINEFIRSSENPSKLNPRTLESIETTSKQQSKSSTPNLFPGPTDKSDAAKFNRFWDKKDEKNQEPEAQGQLDLVKTWDKPPYELLSDAKEVGISNQEIEETSRIIANTFAEYRIEIGVEKVRPGPTVTMYGIEPGWIRKYKRVRVKDENGNPKKDSNGKPIVAQQEDHTRVSVDNILRREKDLALALKTPSLRIETPVMGESLLGIEVPNPNPSLVTMRKVMESTSFSVLKKKANIPVALGRGSDGDEVVFDLARMPHLLIAGATGSGKSVCLNALISCLIMERTPSEVQLLLIDPKRVELTPFNGIPHLITPVVVENDKVVNLLKGLIQEMMDRYRTMEENGTRNIEGYNRKNRRTKMPYIVVAIDELADLMMTAAFDTEQSICRLAQLGRATGIHLIIATQRPSVDVITGLIKANFPSRISFSVTSQIDSRTILDAVGAEKLLGRGDMLYQPIDATRPTRVQSVFISDQEIEAIVNHWKKVPLVSHPKIDISTVEYIQEDSNMGLKKSSQPSSNRDALTDRAIDLANRHSKISTSLLQRRLRIGYPRAARLMDDLEEMGIVGPSDGSKSRDVIITSN